MKHNEVRLLKYLLANNQRSVPLPAWAKPQSIVVLAALSLIEITADMQSGFITDTGISALRDHHDKVIALAFDRAIAVLTILISIAALIVSVIALKQS